eukprot:3540342-Pyramimonas_sp.AAC.1
MTFQDVGRLDVSGMAAAPDISSRPASSQRFSIHSHPPVVFDLRPTAGPTLSGPVDARVSDTPARVHVVADVLQVLGLQPALQTYDLQG